MTANEYSKVNMFRDKLEGTFIDEKEYLHRLEFFLGDVVQILETATIDDKSRKLIYSKISKINDNVSAGCLYQFHSDYMKWCKSSSK